MPYEKVEEIRRQGCEMGFQYWLHSSVFTWQWWLLVILVFVPWIIWWILADKKRLLEISLYGTLIAIICIFLDVAGQNLMLWGYPKQILYFVVEPILPIDLCILPVEHLLIYQYFRRWTWFLVILIVAALVNSFIAEPIFVWAGIYKMYSWEYVYSTPIYIAKGIVARLVVQWVMQYQTRQHSYGRSRV